MSKVWLKRPLKTTSSVQLSGNATFEGIPHLNDEPINQVNYRFNEHKWEKKELVFLLLKRQLIEQTFAALNVKGLRNGSNAFRSRVAAPKKKLPDHFSLTAKVS